MSRIKKLFVYMLIIFCIISSSSCAYDEIVDEEEYKNLKASKIGIGGGGMLHSPTISNFDPDTMMVAADMGGVYVSNDAGMKWERKNLRGTVITTYMDPVREGVLYAGGSGLWRSTDNGQNFKLIFPREDDIIDTVTMNENGLQYIFTKSKIYPKFKYIKSIVVNPKNPNNIYVLAYYGKEGIVFESTDNGENFNQLFAYKQEKPDESIFYDLHKLIYKQETDELFCITDEEIFKYNREEQKAESIYKSNLGLVDACSIYENNKTWCIIIENIDSSEKYETKVFYTNDFNTTTDITEKIIKGQKTEFDYNGNTITFKWKFNYIAASSLNNIYITHKYLATGYPWSTCAVLRFDGDKSIYRYGLPFRNHNNLKGKGWADGNLVAYGIATTKQKPEMCVETTLIGVNYFENDEDIYQRYCTNINNGSAYTTSGINEQTTYGVEIDPFNKNHMLLLNTDLGLISSNDNGTTWTRANSGIKSTWVNTIYDAEFDKNQKGVVYSLWSGRHDAPYAPGNETAKSTVHGGFAISLDGGKTWDCNYSSGLPENTTPVKMALVYGENNQVTIYVATFKHGFFISTDNGKTFQAMNEGITPVHYKDGDDYEYILASDIEAVDGKIFGITAKSTYQSGIQKGEVFEYINEKWQKIEMPENHTTPRDVYYHNGSLYISSTANTIWNYKDGKDFSNYAGGIFEYNNGAVTQIFDESISTTGVQIDSKGNMYVSDINGNIYRKEVNSNDYKKIYDSYHYVSKGIQLTDDDTIYLAAFGGGVLKLEGLTSLIKYEPNIDIIGDIDGDGKITINDLAKLKLYLIDKITLTEKELNLADMDSDNKVTINDLARLKAVLIGDIDNIIRVSSIQDMKLLSTLKNGDVVETKGYYGEEFGGKAKYKIVDKSLLKVDDKLCFKLDNGLYAELIIENDTITLKQIGAYGDGIHDDTSVISYALNSEIKNIEFPKAEYKITKYIRLENGNINVLGNDSVIFTDNDYKPDKYSEFLFYISGDNYSFKDLQIEARETQNLENLYISQVYVGSSNIEFKSCNFKVPETTCNKHQYNNIDLYTGWHNVLIEDCNLYLAHDGTAGGCIWVRDFYNRGASDLTFKNNTCYKKCHDEILAIFRGTIENVEISGNKFIMPESTDPSVMCFTIGSDSSQKADNIKFENNEINCISKMNLFTLHNSSNVYIKNNKIQYTKPNIEFSTGLIYIPQDNVSNLQVINNNIELYNKSEQAMSTIISSRSKDIKFISNTVTVNSPIKEAFSDGLTILENNITFNGSVHIIANKPRDFINNNIVLKEHIDAYFQYYNGNLEWQSNIKNNTFNYSYDEISSSTRSTILLLNGVNLNGNVINFEENTINGNNLNSQNNYLYIITLKDETPQTIRFIDNDIIGYTKKSMYNNKVTHNVFFE